MSEIKLTITGADPFELFSTIKDCAVLMSDNVPVAELNERVQAPKSQPANPTPASAATPVNTVPSVVPSAQGIQKPAPIHTPPVGQTAPVAQSSAPNPTVPLTPVPAQAPISTPPAAAAVPTAAPTVPTTPAPAYTLDQLSRAGADLITAHPELMDKLNAIMTSYGVQTIVQLPKDRYGDLALKLRGLGAQI